MQDVDFRFGACAERLNLDPRRGADVHHTPVALKCHFYGMGGKAAHRATRTPRTVIGVGPPGVLITLCYAVNRELYRIT